MKFLIFGIAVAITSHLSSKAIGGEPSKQTLRKSADFPSELVDFVPYQNELIFDGTGQDTWDNKIRERGYILREDGQYHMWYTGYNDVRSNTKYLGYATSPDGIH